MNPTRRMIQALFLCCALISVHLSSPAPAPASAAPIPPTATPLPDLPIPLAGPAAQPPVPNAPLAIDTITTIACTVGTCPPTPDYPDPSLVGQSYIVYFQVREDPSTPGSSPLGTVTVDDGEGHSCSRTLDSDPGGEYEEGWQWNCSLASTTVGTKTLTATFTPLDPLTYNGSSGTEPHTVDKADTTTAVTYLPPSPRACDVVTFTATVSPVPPAGGTPSAGLVTFFDGVVLLGSEALNASGQASYGTSALSVGSHVISAVYAGNDDYNGSASPAVNVTVAKANSTTSVTTLAPNPSTFGNAVTLRATVTGGCGTPTGLVSFNDGGTAVGTAALNASGTADLVLSNLAAGTHQITAVYHGDDTYLASMSSAHTHTVNKANTTTTLSGSPNPALAGQTVTFVATTTVAAPGSGAAAGTVTFWDGVAYLGSATLDGAGQALLSTSALGSGAHSITAQYGGNANLNGSTSAPFGLTVLAEADLALEKTGPPAAVAGELLSYQLAVHNAGPDDAVDVVVTDTLPAALEYLGNTAGCSLLAGELVCALGDIPAGGSRSLQILTRVPADAVAATPDGLTATLNVATVASDVNDSSLGDNSAEAATFIADRADLRVTKVSRPATTVAAGEMFTYTIAVDNGGPSFARGVVFSDTILSSGSFTLLGIDADPLRADSCATVPASGGLLIVCTLDDPLEVPGYGPANGRWTVGVRVRATEAQEVHNRVEVRAATPDADLANNEAVDFVSVTAVADLAVSKTGPGVVTAGGTAEFVVTVENSGPSTARNVVLEDELPAGMTVLSLAHPGMACSQSGSGPTTVRCGAGDLATGASRTLTVTVAVDAALADGTLLVNSAQVGGDDFDPDNGDNYVRITAVVASSAALSVVKSGTPDAAAGEGVNYTIAVSNNGPSAAQDVYVVDALPGEVEVLSAGILRGVNGTPAGSGGTCQTVGGEVACQLGQMPVGEQAAVVIAGRVRADAVPPSDVDGTIEVTNAVTVTASNAAPQQAQATTTVQRLSDLRLDKTGDPAVAYAGDLVHYTLTVHNAGPSDAAGAVVTDTLPAALDYQIDTGGCALVGTGPQVLRCELGAVAAGQTRTIDVHARVRPDITPNSVAVNQAVVASAPADPQPADNTDTASTYLLGRADLRVLKFGLPGGQVAAGGHLTYTIVVDNLGPGYAHDVAVSDQMLSSGTFHVLALASDRAATCGLTPPGTFTGWLEFACTLDDPLPPLAAGDSRWTLTLVVSADEVQTLSNTASVSGSDADPNLGNNHASVQHQVAAAADVELVKTAAGQVQVDGMPAGTFAPAADQVTAGGLLTYTLTAINHGPSTAYNVALQDRLPAWIELVSVSTTQGFCNLGQPGNLAAPQVCNLGTLAAGSAATVTIVARVPAWLPAGHTFYNEAFVVSGSYDPLNSNDMAVNLTTVDRWSDLEITKVGQTVSYPTHQGMVYTVTVTNHGPSDVAGAVISDTLPAGLIDATWQCTASGGATCTAAGVGNLYETVDLPVGGTVVYTLQAKMPRWRSLTNTATVTVGVGSNDPIGSNNRATVTSAEPYILFMPVVACSGGLSAPDLVVTAIAAATNSIQVTIENQGSAAVTNGFWVDLYIDPAPPPRAVNQVWGNLSQQGAVWGVPTGALPLQPGQTLLLTIGDAYYRADLSRITWPLPLGAAVYAQVDSYNPATLYGLVLETHEITGGPYNNIMGPVSTSLGSR